MALAPALAVAPALALALAPALASALAPALALKPLIQHRFFKRRV